MLNGAALLVGDKDDIVGGSVILKNTMACYGILIHSLLYIHCTVHTYVDTFIYKHTYMHTYIHTYTHTHT